MELSRKDFIKLLFVFGAGGAVAACGPSGDCSKNGAHHTLITENHGHELTVPAGDFTANMDKTYSIVGVSSHDHNVTLTAAQLADIAGGTPVTVQSTTTNGHFHQVTVACA